MNKRSRKTKGLSHRLIALLLCCVCLLATTPVSAVALGIDMAVAAEADVTVEPTKEAAAEPETMAAVPVPTALLSPEDTSADTGSTEIITEADTAVQTEITEESETTTSVETETTETASEPETTIQTEITTESETTSAAESETSAASTETNTETQTEQSEADALYERLMSCTTYEELEAALNALTEEEQLLIAQLTDEQNAALRGKMNELGAYGVETLQDRGEFTIEQGKSQAISIGNMKRDGLTGYTCKLSQAGITVTYQYGWDSGYTISVGNNVPAGTYTLTVKYQTTSWSWGGTTTNDNTDIVTITVPEKSAEYAQIYYLKTPTSNPDSNDVEEWGDCISDKGIVKTDGATWKNDKNVFNPDPYVISMPGMKKQENGSWLLSKDIYSAHYTAIFNAYKQKLQEELGVILNIEDIEAIYLTPYKISKNNNTDPDKHIDCTVSIKTTKVFAAVFWVTLPDGTVKQVDAKNYKTGTQVAKTEKAPTDPSGNYPDIIVRDGVTYRFDGWYNEADEQIAENDWAYTPDDAELADGTVNFYARYVPTDVELTIKKTVSGNMQDSNQEFTFTVTADKDMTYGESIGKTITFNLKKNQEVTISVPVGAFVTVSEDAAGYTYSLSSETTIKDYTGLENGIQFTMPKDDSTVVFNNEKNISIDTGVILDTLPYILILAVVVVGIVLLIKRRRIRGND